MNESIKTLLDQMPERPPRSKLEPHTEVIRQLRRKGRTYKEIAFFFALHLNIKVAPSTIHAFVRVRARRGERRPVEFSAGSQPTPFQSHASSAGSDVEIRKRIEELKRRKPLKEPETPRFEYDENEPLVLRATSEGGSKSQ
jgi:hypothetical protein